MERFFGKICSRSIMPRKARINVTKCLLSHSVNHLFETSGCTVSLCVSMSSRVTTTFDDLNVLYFLAQVLVKWARGHLLSIIKVGLPQMGHFPITFWPLFQNEFRCLSFHSKFSFAFAWDWKQIVIWKDEYQDSLWKTGQRQFGNGLLSVTLDISLSAFT